MGSKYVVDIEFRQSGDPSALADKAGEKVEKLKSNFQHTKAASSELGGEFVKLGSSAVSAFTGVVETVGMLGVQLAAVGASTAIGAVTYGVIGLNSELETTKVSLGAVLNANDKAKGIEQGVEMAAGWIAQMKKDARDLPGEFEDLLGIVQSSAGTAFNAGMDVDKFEKVASSVMAAAKALHVQTDQAGRELAQLFEGRAGAHNVLGMRLKIDAHALYEDIDKVKKHFKDLSAEGRVKAIEDAVGKFEPAIKAFGKTYDAQSSTLVDNVKNLIQIGTKGLFGSVVKDLSDINNWFDANRGKVEGYAKDAGHWLVDVHDKARKIAEEWIPVLKDFGVRAYGKFVELWKDAAPIIEGIAHSVKDFMSDKDSLERLERILKLYVAAKVGGSLAGGGPFAGIMKAGIKDLGGGGDGAEGGGAGGGAMKSAAGAAGLAALLGIGLAVWQGEGLKHDVTTRENEGWAGAENMAKVLAERQGGGHIAFNEDTEGALADARASGSTLAATADHVVGGLMKLDLWSENAGSMVGHVVALASNSGKAAEDMQLAAIKLHNAGVAIDEARQYLERLKKPLNAVEGDVDPNKKKKKDAAGSANMTVNGNINFTISSNQAPDQIAREVERRLIDKRRFRTSSPGTRNFSVLPSGT